jgi:ATP-dependent helicase HrpA
VNNPSVQELKARIPLCMIRDRFRFGKEIHGKNSRGRLAQRIDKSVQLLESRKRSVPQVSYPEALPISSRVEDIMVAVRQNQVVIIAGETGSGKTTQIPKICLDLGLGVSGMIGHTQPRVVAARTVSQRIAEELAVKVGGEVGFQVRFTDKSSDATHIKVMTDGILLAETQNDRFLEKYDAIIIDEAHERSLNIDFLLGYLKRILPKRPDLKVIVTSATIDVQRFSRHFNDAPVIEVSGRTYPVEVLYRPFEASKSEDADQQVYSGILDALHEVNRLEKSHRDRGDTLVFLPGEREIRETAAEIRKSDLKNLEVLPLYSRLSVAEQNRIFQPHSRPRVILATNVAETSLTVPGIRYVIDPGVARISRYSYRSKVQQLPVEPVSQASAEQRKGRCGRVSAGVCIRLYSEEDFQSRAEFTQPEIMRTNLASVILQMLMLRLGDMEKFPFVEKPDQRQINDGFHLLFELQAVDNNRHITRLGRDMAKFPVDLRFARMILAAGRSGCLEEILTITSALSIADPRERPHDHQQAADQAHRKYWDQQSDFLALVNLWNSYEEERQQMTQGQLRKYCRANFISFIRMREWRDIHRQLRLVCRELKLKENQGPADYASVHRALLSGLLGNVGEKTSENEYTGARNRIHFIFPGSSQFKSKPKWIACGELVETTRLFARNVCRIDPVWLEPLAQHLLKRRSFEPHFDAKQGQVFAFEEVTLYGVVIVKRRRVDFGSIDPVQAREIFIQSGLVEQQLNSGSKFYVHNKRLIDEVENLESKSRKRDILVDNYAMYEFYDKLLPASICSDIDLRNFIKENQSDPKKNRLLYLSRDQLMKQKVELSETLYPNKIKVADAELKLDYHFDPQHEDDGVTINIPVAILRQVSKAQLDWVTPGLLREKCLALIRSLPKSKRKHFVPAPDYADRAVDKLEYDGRELTEVLAERLFRMTGDKVTAEDFNIDNLDKHLNMNIRILDDKGKVIGRGRNIEHLRESYATEVSQSFKDRTRHTIEQDGLTDWTFGELPAEIELKQANMTVKGYPALIDRGDTVAVEILDNRREANGLSCEGLVTLAMLQLKDQAKYVRRNIPRFQQFSLYYATRGNKDDLLRDIVRTVFRYTFVEDLPLVTTQAAFRERLMEKGKLMVVANDVSVLLQAAFKEVHEIDKVLASGETDLNSFAFNDVRKQLAELVGPGFLHALPQVRLKQYPRYLKAIGYRLEKLKGNLARDREATAEIGEFTNRLTQVQGSRIEEAEQYRWMLEEYRVSLFAQAVGTSMPISAKRLEKQWTVVESQQASAR